MPAAMRCERTPGSALAARAGLDDAATHAWLRLRRHALLVLLLAPLLILWLGAATDIDLRLADAAFDRAAGAFPWRDAWLADTFSHVIVKRILVALGLAAIALALWDLALPARRGWLRRFQIRVVALSALLVPAVIALLKQLSASHCPWDLQRYGGAEPYVRLLEALPQGVAPGHCMPAGHASSALWLVSLVVLFPPRRPRAAALALALLLGLGFALGWLQQLRGAHFLTHTLWSMWIACAIVYALIRVLERQARGR